MPRISAIIVALYILFNLAIAATLIFDPSQLDRTYRGGVMTPTREFLWFSVASFHLLVVAVDLPGLSAEFLKRMIERRQAGGGTLPVGGRGMEPLCAVYPVGRALEAVRAWGASGESSPRRLVSDGLREGWMEAWPVEGADLACLVNWNRPEDWDSGFDRAASPDRFSGPE